MTSTGPSPAERPVLAGAPLGRPSHVLVVDDELEIRGYLCEVLEGLGYEVSSARNGRQLASRAVDVTRAGPRGDGHAPATRARPSG